MKSPRLYELIFLIVILLLMIWSVIPNNSRYDANCIAELSDTSNTVKFWEERDVECTLH